MSNNGKHKTAVFYHAPCIDGAASAWAAHEKWKDDAEYVGINHGNEADLKKLIMGYVDDHTHVVFADYCPPPALLAEIADHAESIAVYDHHHSAIEKMKTFSHPQVKTYFDESKSGGAIVWDELFNNKRRPQGIELAQMIDLERVGSKNFYSVAAYVDSFELDSMPNILSTFNTLNKLKIESIYEKGDEIRRYHATAIDKTLESLAWVKLELLPATDPVWVPIVNANVQHLGREFSVRLKQLAERSPPGFVALSWYEDKGTVRVSVRTGGMPDAGKIAAHIGSRELDHGLGGGGHPNSAAAQFTIEQFNEQFKRKNKEQVLADLMASKPVILESPEAEKVVDFQRATHGR